MYQFTNGGISVQVAEDGHFQFVADGISLSNCLPSFAMEGEVLPGCKWEITAGASQIILKNTNLIGRWEIILGAVRNAAGRDGVSLRMKGTLNGPVHDLEYSLLSGATAELTHFQGQGQRMGDARSMLLPQKEQNFTVWYTCVLTNSGHHFVFTAPLRSTSLPAYKGTAGNALSNFAITGTLHNVSTTEIDTGDICIFTGDAPQQALEEWAEENATIKNPPICREYGWNSWDYYLWTITEEEVLENARFIANDPILSQKIKRIIIDDGWQYCYGEWDPNPYFPHGMKYLADQITALGFEPGLWIAPTLVEPHCHIALRDYDMLALSEGGQPTLAFNCMERQAFFLDPTVPKAQEFIRKTFDKYAEMGFKYFKLDFMGTTLKARRFHDESIPRSEIPRLIVKAAYEGVKGRAKILGCNYIFGGGNEFVNDVRISSDIHARWDSVVDNAIATAVNAHTNNRLWRNDPDFAVIRGRDTSEDPELLLLKCNLVYTRPEDKYVPIYDYVLSDLSLAQAEVSVSLVLMAAGAINLSDKMTRLNAKGLDILHRLVSAPLGETAIALDQFESIRPALWLQKVDGRFARALLINWTDQEQELQIDLAKHGITATTAKDFWHDTTIDISQGILKATLPPTSCLLATF